MKMLLSQQVLCTPYNYAPCHFMRRPKPHMFGACVFSCNLPPALLAEWQGSFTCYCSTKKTAELVKLWKWRGSAKGTAYFDFCNSIYIYYICREMLKKWISNIESMSEWINWQITHYKPKIQNNTQKSWLLLEIMLHTGKQWNISHDIHKT